MAIKRGDHNTAVVKISFHRLAGAIDRQFWQA